MKRVTTLLLLVLFAGPEMARGQTGVAARLLLDVVAAARHESTVALPAGARLNPGGIDMRQLVELALTGNADLLATRQRTLEAQGLLRQAGFRPNPGVEASVSSGSMLGSAGEHEVSLGYAHTFELGGKLARRLDVAQRVADVAEL